MSPRSELQARVDAIVPRIAEVLREAGWSDADAAHLFACMAGEAASRLPPSKRHTVVFRAQGLVQSNSVKRPHRKPVPYQDPDA